jgi:hypothetical protein
LPVGLEDTSSTPAHPYCQNTTSKNVRWMSMPITRRTQSLQWLARERWAARQLRIRARSATGQVAGAASY